MATGSITTRKAQLQRAQRRIQIRSRLINLRQKRQVIDQQIKSTREELKSS